MSYYKLVEKRFISANKTLTVVEGDVEYPYIEIASEDDPYYNIHSYEFFTKEQLDEFIEYLISVKERWS